MDRRAFLVKSGSVAFGVGMLSLNSGVLDASSRKATTKTASGLTPVSLQESYINNAEFAGYYCAAKKGFFKKYGLDVDIVAAGASTDPRQSVANGASLLGIVSETSDMILGIGEGVPYKCFGAPFQQNPGCLLVLANSGIYSVKDLEGKTIGIQPNALQQIRGILAANHVPLDKVTLTIVDDSPEPLVLGKIDAYTAYVFNEPISLAMQGIKTRCYSFSNIGLPGYGDCLIATDHTIATQGELLARFMRASQEGWAYSIAHPTEAVAITLDDYPSGQVKQQQELQMKAQLPMLESAETKAHGLLWVSTLVMQAALNAQFASGSLKKRLTVNDVMTQEILDRAKSVSPV
jgi:ABC-type nitrate/sulfonate/bicarbonate transport system substrate-binding protein